MILFPCKLVCTECRKTEDTWCRKASIGYQLMNDAEEGWRLSPIEPHDATCSVDCRKVIESKRRLGGADG